MSTQNLVVIKKNLFKEGQVSIQKMAFPPDKNPLKDSYVVDMIHSRVPQLKVEGSKPRRALWVYVLPNVEVAMDPFRWVSIKEEEFATLTKGVEEVDILGSEHETLKETIKGLEKALEEKQVYIHTLEQQVLHLTSQVALLEGSKTPAPPTEPLKIVEALKQ